MECTSVLALSAMQWCHTFLPWQEILLRSPVHLWYCCHGFYFSQHDNPTYIVWILPALLKRLRKQFCTEALPFCYLSLCGLTVSPCAWQTLTFLAGTDSFSFCMSEEKKTNPWFCLCLWNPFAGCRILGWVFGLACSGTRGWQGSGDSHAASGLSQLSEGLPCGRRSTRACVLTAPLWTHVARQPESEVGSGLEPWHWIRNGAPWPALTPGQMLVPEFCFVF